jgi:hypothetical protein
VQANPADRGLSVDEQAKKKDRRPKTPGASKIMDQSAEAQGKLQHNAAPETNMEDGLTPNLQAHIGRHVRALFDEVAREPIPDRLLQLLKDLERSGDK